MHALSVKGLTKTYRNGVQALKGIDLDVEEGEAMGLRELLHGLRVRVLGEEPHAAAWRFQQCLERFGRHGVSCYSRMRRKWA